MGDTRPQGKTIINERESSREQHTCKHVTAQCNFVQEVRRIVPNDFVWEICRVQHRAKCPNNSGYDLSTNK